MMTYKGYTAAVEFDEDAGVFSGRVTNVRDVITFVGKSVDELRAEFRASVDDYLAFCEERGEEPEKPYSGRFLVRISPEQHRMIANAAARAGVSLNAWVTHALRSAIGRSSKPSLAVEYATARSDLQAVVHAVPPRSAKPIFGSALSLRSLAAQTRGARKSVDLGDLANQSTGEWRVVGADA